MVHCVYVASDSAVVAYQEDYETASELAPFVGSLERVARFPFQLGNFAVASASTYKAAFEVYS